MEPVFFTSVVALLLSALLVAECYRASCAKVPQLLNGNTGSTYHGPALSLKTHGKSKLKSVNQVLSARTYLRHTTRSVWCLGLAVVTFALSMSSDMQAVRKSRFVTLTNSAEALSLELLVSDFLNHKDFGPENTLKAYLYYGLVRALGGKYWEGKP